MIRGRGGLLLLYRLSLAQISFLRWGADPLDREVTPAHVLQSTKKILSHTLFFFSTVAPPGEGGTQVPGRAGRVPRSLVSRRGRRQVRAPPCRAVWGKLKFLDQGACG